MTIVAIAEATTPKTVRVDILRRLLAMSPPLLESVETDASTTDGARTDGKQNRESFLSYRKYFESSECCSTHSVCCFPDDNVGAVFDPRGRSGRFDQPTEPSI
jgi:hypothetical protein